MKLFVILDIHEKILKRGPNAQTNYFRQSTISSAKEKNEEGLCQFLILMQRR